MNVTEYSPLVYSNHNSSSQEKSSPKHSAAIDQFIQDNYILVSNVANVSEAQIICLGEDHLNQSQREFNAKIIDLFSTEDSILLVEETKRKANESLEDLKKFQEEMYLRYKIKTPVKVDGWDIVCDDKQLNEVRKLSRAGEIYVKPRAKHFIKLSKLTKFQEDMAGAKTNCQQSTSLLSGLCTLCCAALFVKCCNPCIKQYYGSEVVKGFQKIINRFPERNLSMCRTIQETSEIYRRIFVIAGSMHFSIVEDGDGEKGVDYTPSNLAVIDTMEFLKGKTYAILISKSDAEFFSSNQDNEETKLPI